MCALLVSHKVKLVRGGSNKEARLWQEMRSRDVCVSMQEGPHSALNEDEFFDALEMAYQKDEMVANLLNQ